MIHYVGESLQEEAKRKFPNGGHAGEVCTDCNKIWDIHSSFPKGSGNNYVTGYGHIGCDEFEATITVEGKENSMPKINPKLVELQKWRVAIEKLVAEMPEKEKMEDFTLYYDDFIKRLKAFYDKAALQINAPNIGERVVAQDGVAGVYMGKSVTSNGSYNVIQTEKGIHVVPVSYLLKLEV